MLRRSEVLGEQGDVDGSQAAATQAEAIKVSLTCFCSNSLRLLLSEVDASSIYLSCLQARRKELEEEALETAKANINRYGEQVRGHHKLFPVSRIGR